MNSKECLERASCAYQDTDGCLGCVDGSHFDTWASVEAAMESAEQIPEDAPPGGDENSTHQN